MAPNATLQKIMDTRPDLSDYVYHFTKRAQAIITLEAILRDKKLVDKNSRGFISFTEAPLNSLPDMFDEFSGYEHPMYAPYGIAILKSYLFDLGGMPVIYGRQHEINLIDPSIHWRFEVYDDERDFTWLREWRINTKELELTPDNSFIITKEEYELNHLTHDHGEIIVGAERSDGGWETTFDMEMIRAWKSISIEEVRALKSKAEFQQKISGQEIGKVDFHGYLGSMGPG